MGWLKQKSLRFRPCIDNINAQTPRIIVRQNILKKIWFHNASEDRQQKKSRWLPVREQFLFKGVDRKIIMHQPVFITLVIVCLTIGNAAAENIHTAGLAMYGQPRYLDGFRQFDYVNADAPKGGTLKLAASGTFDSLNPFIIRGQPALGLNTGFLSLIYEPLMTRSQDEPFTLYGLIAEKVTVAPDRSHILFTINPNARWSDGEALTADDVLFSYTTLRDKGRPNHRLYYRKVAKAELVGPYQIKFTFRPDSEGLYDHEMPLIMGLMPVLPRHDWTNREFGRTTLKIPVGSGPYIISDVDIGRSITYRRNPDYWGHDLAVEHGLHNFDTIHIDYYRDEGIALQAFKSGQYDWRRENDPTRWATAYDFPAVHDGRVAPETFAHQRTEPAGGFIFNLRRKPMADEILRAALQYTFNFAWINRNLFHGQYHRTESFFPNSELAAPPLPVGRELKILDHYRDRLPPSLFTRTVHPPETDGSEEGFRQNLLTARVMLREAGYILHDNQLYTPHEEQPVAFEILLSDPVDEKVALTWGQALKRIGITARIHTVDSAQYQERLAGFDYDVTVNKWVNSLSPGNEQSNYWGSAAADMTGSRNYAGVKNPVIDTLAGAIPLCTSRDELVASVHALDRVLMASHIMIPFYYLGADHIASWADRVGHPAITPLYGTVMESWWSVHSPQ